MVGSIIFTQVNMNTIDIGGFKCARNATKRVLQQIYRRFQILMVIIIAAQSQVGSQWLSQMPGQSLTG